MLYIVNLTIYKHSLFVLDMHVSMCTDPLYTWVSLNSTLHSVRADLVKPRRHPLRANDTANVINDTGFVFDDIVCAFYTTSACLFEINPLFEYNTDWLFACIA